MDTQDNPNLFRRESVRSIYFDCTSSERKLSLPAVKRSAPINAMEVKTVILIQNIPAP